MEPHRSNNSLLSLSLLIAGGCVAQVLGGESERVLRFPADRAVGRVYQRPSGDDKDVRSKYDGWTEVGDARGDVTVGTSDVVTDSSVLYLTSFSPNTERSDDFLEGAYVRPYQLFRIVGAPTCVPDVALLHQLEHLERFRLLLQLDQVA